MISLEYQGQIVENRIYGPAVDGFPEEIFAKKRGYHAKKNCKKGCGTLEEVSSYPFSTPLEG